MGAPPGLNLPVASINRRPTRWARLGLWWAGGVVTAPARGIVIGHQRYGWLNLIVSGGWVLTVVLIVVLFELGWISLAAVGTAFLAIGVCKTVWFLLLVRHLQPDLRWSPRLIGRPMLRFGAWNNADQPRPVRHQRPERPFDPCGRRAPGHDREGLGTMLVRSTRTGLILSCAGSGLLTVVAADLFRL